MAKKYLFILVFGWLAGAGLSLAWARDAYLSLAPDIPLAPVLSEIDGGQLVLTNRKDVLSVLRLNVWRYKARATGCRLLPRNVAQFGWQLSDTNNSADSVLTFQRETRRCK